MEYNSSVAINIGSVQIYEGDVIPTLWWLCLTVGSLFNCVFLACRLANLSKDPYPRHLTQLACVFIFACSVRSVWPRVDVERICFWDSWISWPFVGRCLATVAEICFAAQLSSTTSTLASNLSFPLTKRVADLAFWPLCIAQGFCWCGVTSTMQIWHVFEESLWALTIGVLGLCYTNMYLTAIRSSPGSPCSFGRDGYAKRYLAFGAPFACAFTVFMVLVDIPMYWYRYLENEASGLKYLTMSEGLLDMMTCHKVSKSAADWMPEIPWMSGYFLGATLLSLWLTWGPTLRLKDDAKRE